MSTVYEPHDAALCTRVMVKTPRDDLPSDHVDHFRREGHVLASLNHEHLARIIEPDARALPQRRHLRQSHRLGIAKLAEGSNLAAPTAPPPEPGKRPAATYTWGYTGE